MYLLISLLLEFTYVIIMLWQYFQTNAGILQMPASVHGVYRVYNNPIIENIIIVSYAFLFV